MNRNLVQLQNSKQANSVHRLVNFGVALAVSLGGVTACKSRFFSFSEDPVDQTNTQIKNDAPQARQVAIGGQNNANSNADPKPNAGTLPTAAPFAVVSGTELKIKLGSTQKLDINGQTVEVTFESIIEDSRCPSDVMCIWEGQAKLQFSIQVAALNLSKKVTPTLRVGHPELGQVVVGALALQLVGLAPDSKATNQKADSPEATVVLGKAP